MSELSLDAFISAVQTTAPADAPLDRLQTARAVEPPEIANRLHKSRPVATLKIRRLRNEPRDGGP